MNPSSSSAPRNDLRIRDALSVLRKRWKIVAIAAAVGATFAVAFQLFFPKQYESNAQLLVMRKDAKLAARGVEGGSDAEVKVTEELLATHMQLLQSRSLVDGALKEEQLFELPSITSHLSDNIKPSEYVIGKLAVTRGGKGQARAAHILNIAYRSSSAIDAKVVLDAIVKKYQGFLSEKFQDVNQEAASLISQAQSELAYDLENAEREYEQFRQESTNLMWKAGAETTNIYRVRYEAILQEIAMIQLARSETAARLDAVDDLLNGPDAEELTDLEKLSLVDEKNLTRVGLLLMAQRGETESPVFQSEQPIRLAQAKVELENHATMQMKEKSLLTDLGERHPDVINIRKQIGAFESFVEDQKRNLTTGGSNFSLDPKALFKSYHRLLTNDVRAMNRREERLDVLADEALRQASDMVTYEIQGDSLRREVKLKQDLLDTTMDRLRDINLAKDYGGFINEVLAEPEVGMKVMPRASHSLALGAMLSVAICFAGIGVAEFRDRRFRAIADLEHSLQLPVLGQIPLVSKSTRSGGIKRRAGPGENPSLRIVDHDSKCADAFRLLRTSRLFATGEQHRQILAFTSPLSGDGKSTVTANLAASLGQLGRKILIIDSDLRRPRQHEIFSLANERGLTTVISAGHDPSDYIQETSKSNVWLMPRGESVENPSEFLATGEFGRLLESLRDKFDHILIDCPPVLLIPDTLACCSNVDGVIVVVRGDRTTQIQAHTTCNSLRRVGVQLEGVVVNGLTGDMLSDESYGYGYGYGYSPYDDATKNATAATPTEINGSRIESMFHRNGKS